MNFAKIKNFYLLYYFIFLFIVTFYYLITLNVVETYNAMTEWLINYQGGFVRRGFFGEVLFKISQYLNLDLKFSILITQTTLYGIFYYLIYLLIKELKLNKFLLFIIFSPVFLFYPIAELEALGRKEILVSILFLTISIFFRQNIHLKIYVFFLGSLIVLLTHEIIVFYFLNFFIFLLILNKRNSFFLNVQILFIFLILTLITGIIFFNNYTPLMKENMCLSLIENFSIKCGFQTHYVANPIGTYIGEVDWKLNHYLRNGVLYLLGFGPIIIFSSFLKFNKDKCNSMFVNIPVIILLIIFSIVNLLIFFISVDTGRYFHLAYTNIFIFLFGLIYKEIIYINYENLNKFEKKYLPNNKIIFILLFFFISFSWSPKATFGEDFGSFPIYRSIEKMPNFYQNLKKFRVKKVSG